MSFPSEIKMIILSFIGPHPLANLISCCKMCNCISSEHTRPIRQYKNRNGIRIPYSYNILCCECQHLD